MENWRENFSMISRLKAAGNQTDALATRLFFERLFAGANFHPFGVSQKSVVCIKKINAPPLKNDRQNFAGGNLALEWEHRIRGAVEKLTRRAFRPIREAVPTEADSVIFEDKAELLACLAQDWRRGALAGHWWWRALFPNLWRSQTPLMIWLGLAEFAPFAIQILSKNGGAENFVEKLSPPEALELLYEITRIFGLDKLSAALSDAPEKVTRTDKKLARKPAGKSRISVALNSAGATDSAAFFEFLLPESKLAGLSFERSLLLETALLLARSPRHARSPEFAERVRIYRLESEFRQAAESRKSGVIAEKNKALEIGAPRRRTKKRRLPGEGEIQINKPATAKTKSSIFDLDSKEKSAEHFDKPSIRLNKSQATEKPAIEPKKTGAAAKPSNIEFENAPSENEIEKNDRKAKPEIEKFIPPKVSEQSFENFFEDSETDVEFVFQTRFGGVFYLLNLGLFLGLYRDFTGASTAEIDLNVWDFVALLGVEFLGGQIKTDAVWAFLKRAAERENDREFGREFEQFQDWRMPLEWLETFSGNRDWRWAKTAQRLVVSHAEGFNVIDVSRRGDPVAQLKNELKIYRKYFSRIVKTGKKNKPIRSVGWLKNLAEYLRKRLVQALNLQTPKELNALLFERQATISVSPTHLEITFALADLPIEVRLAGIDRDPAWIPAAGKFVYFHFV